MKITIEKRDGIDMLIRSDIPNWARPASPDEVWLANRVAELERRLGITQETEACRIHEYDGAFKCMTHDRMWGAVTKPDEPCAGWSASETRDDRPRCEHGYLKGEGFEAFTICPTCNVLNR